MQIVRLIFRLLMHHLGLTNTLNYLEFILFLINLIKIPKMKKTTQLAILLFIGLFSNAKAQTIPFTNGLSCDLTILVEFYDPTILPPFCGGCHSATLTIAPGNTLFYTIPATCPGVVSDACITVLDIGGFPPPTNQISNLSCCTTPATGQTGAIPWCVSGTYTITVTFLSSWSIN